MKSYTSLDQSKKLAKILPLESADMRFCFSHTLSGRITGHYPMIGREPSLGTIPCWSLAALLNVLPKSLIYTPNQALDGYCCKNIMHDLETYGDNPIDACYEMILKLNEENLL